jgi:AbrB family looped-hinge helix DNA binding protein
MKKPASSAANFTATISSRGQMVLPAPVRKRLGLKKGMHVNISFAEGDGDRLIVQPLTPGLIKELRGSFGCAGAALDHLQEERKRDREQGR